MYLFGTIVGLSVLLASGCAELSMSGGAPCQPGQSVCKGDEVYGCEADGTLGDRIQTCPPGTCSMGQCGDPCSPDALSRSYTGCSYWPTVTANPLLAGDFEFAVAVANTRPVPARVTVASQANATLRTATVAPDSLEVIKLPWVNDLRQPLGSLSRSGAAYHLTSDQPVTVYQFNPLDFVLPHDCTQDAEDEVDGRCYSYTNDASLLLPEHTLAKEYMVLAWSTEGVMQGQSIEGLSAGFFSVVAAKPGTTRVTVTFSAPTLAGTGPGGLSAYAKGQTASFDLQHWEVLQLLSSGTDTCPLIDGEYCDFQKAGDLTGTLIQADREVAVFAGHLCANIPFNKTACDHLEEQLLPLSTWGKHYIGTHTASSGADPSLYRVVSADDNNTISFSPAVRPPVVLHRGGYTELTTTQDIEVNGSGRLAVVQYIVGQNYSTEATNGAPGDPAMAQAVPVEQYRTSYRFLAPASYQQNYVNVIAKAGAEVRLDGQVVAPQQFNAVGGSGYSVARLRISGGSHRIDASSAFGITVYGVGAYTSYIYPGGLNLKILLE